MAPEIEADLHARIKAGASPRDAIAAMLAAEAIAHPKQAWRTLEKWAGKGLYDYGVALDLGWLVNP